MSLLIARSERRAWRIAAIAVLVAGGAVAALASLVPLKKAVPYLIEVDRTSGATEVVSVASPRLLAESGVLDRHWVVEYVRARERYDWNLLQMDYDAVIRFSDDSVARQYSAQFEGPDALDKRLGAATDWRVAIVSVTLPANETGKAVVRFDRSVARRDGAGPESVARYIATVAFRYSPALLGPERDLIENPLGFRVTSYLVDRELVDPPAPASDAPPKRAP